MPDQINPNSAAFSFLEMTNFETKSSPHFADWLAEKNVSIALTNTDHLFMIGLKANGELSVSCAPFTRCMGLTRANANTLYLVTEYQIWRLENALPPGQLAEDGCDAIYLPQSAYTTGHLGIHDLAVANDSQVIFTNGLFSCLSTVSERYNFVPLWLPAFLPDLAPADYCHLTGLAMRDGCPTYVTSAGHGVTANSWQDHKRDGGTVIDVNANQIVLTGLSMPFSPRLYRDTLWLTNAGTGQFGRIDLAHGRFEPLMFAPGFLRGLDFIDQFAIIGSSKSRNNEAFQGLALEETLQQQKLEPFHGLQIFDFERGEIAHWFQLDGMAREIYSVIVLPQVKRPLIVGSDAEKIEEWVTIGKFGQL